MWLGLLFFACLCASSLDRERWAKVEAAFREMCSLHKIPWTTFADAFLGVNAAQWQRSLKGHTTFDLRRLYQRDVDPVYAASFHTLCLLELGVVPSWITRAETASALIAQAKKAEVA